MSIQYPKLMVGVTTRRGDPAWTSKNTHNYINTLRSFGVMPVILAPDTPVQLPNGACFTPNSLGQLDAEVLTHLHGLILSGGGDVDPKYYGAELAGAEERNIDLLRDELELSLARAALDTDLPIFGICRGCQVLNVAAGGGMIQHFDGHRSPEGSTKFHDVIVDPASRFSQIVGEEIFAVNTFHHQGMDAASMAPIFTPSAFASPDTWLIEAFESQSHEWVVGVQWHPERAAELGEAHKRLWHSFITACADRATALDHETAFFDYQLPTEAIAQTPAEPRDSSRMLVLHRDSGAIEHRHFYEIGDYLCSDDLLVANDTRVIPARLSARKVSGGKVEIFLLKQLDEEGIFWETLVRGRKLDAGVQLMLDSRQPLSAPLIATIVEVMPNGERHITFSQPLNGRLEELGEIPLPPYITGYHGDRERYQTVYNRAKGSAAAPTAGLHFTPELLLSLRNRGIRFDAVTLHVGLDTFQPVSVEEVEEHPIHSEWAELKADVARDINENSLRGGRVIAVGTTSVRTLEWAATGAQGIDPYDSQACPWQRVAAFAGSVNIFIRPGYRFRAVDALITNFHLPRSTLLLLVSAFIAQGHQDDPDRGRRILLDTYAEAIRMGYRFYSFGDAMLIL